MDGRSPIGLRLLGFSSEVLAIYRSATTKVAVFGQYLRRLRSFRVLFLALDIAMPGLSSLRAFAKSCLLSSRPFASG